MLWAKRKLLRSVRSGDAPASRKTDPAGEGGAGKGGVKVGGVVLSLGDRVGKVEHREAQDPDGAFVGGDQGLPGIRGEAGKVLPCLGGGFHFRCRFGSLLFCGRLSYILRRFLPEGGGKGCVLLSCPLFLVGGGRKEKKAEQKQEPCEKAERKDGKERRGFVVHGGTFRWECGWGRQRDRLSRPEEG
jgi:hypothetical protein